MDPARWQQVTALFSEASAQDEEACEALLAARAEEDPELVEWVRGLLAADGGAGRFLEQPATPARAALPPRFGRYEVVESIGRGGFGEVFRGFDPVLGRPVAIKVADDSSPAARRRFVREASLAARLVHPNVVAIHDFGTSGGPGEDARAYLVQELLPGEDLAAVLGRGERWPLERSLGFLRGVAAGLAYAHGQGVVHRDVKPSNLWVLRDGGVKILDFGIAREVAATSEVTASGELVGTLGYVAPERLLGDAAGFPADLWSFGRVALELLVVASKPGTSELPLGSGRRSLAAGWPQGPRALVELLERCLAVDPAKRPTAGELVASIDGLAQSGALGRRRTRRRLTLAALVLTLVGLAAVFLGRRPLPPATPSPSGRLLVEARPWGELVGLGDLGSRLTLPLPAEATTPLALELPPGDYEAVLRHPRALSAGRCRVRVVAGAEVRCRVVLLDLSAEALLGGGA